MTVRTTKLELEQQLIAQGKELEGLRTQLLDLRAAYKAAREQAFAPDTHAPRVYTPRVYTPRALPAHFVAAREAAMRMGVVTKVAV